METEQRKAQKREAGRRRSARAKTLCTGCRHLQPKERTDFMPSTDEFWCVLSSHWIGFAPVTPEWCPGREELETVMEAAAAVQRELFA